MTQVERVLFVHAHPDDDTITTGGTLATLVDRGAVVTLLTCTRGERGEIIPADLQDALGSHERVAELRVAELERATGILGVTDHRFLGEPDARWEGKLPRAYVDSGMKWGPSGAAEPSGEYDPASLTSAEFGDVAADIAAVILAVQPHAVVSYNERGGYGHPDHVRAHQAARRAADVYGVPFYTIEPAESAARATVSVDVAPVIDRKRGALEAYRSQVVVMGDEFALSNGDRQPIDTVERFRRIPLEGEAPYRFADQSPSARIALSVISALIGLAIGAIGSVYCQSTLSIFGADVWAGPIIGILVLAAFLVGFRLAFATRTLALCAAIATVAITWLFSIESAGGSVLTPLSTQGGLTWAIATVVVAAVVLVWPQARRRAPGNIGGTAKDSKGP